MTTFINTIDLTTLQSIFFIAGCIYIIILGRPELALGIYLSMMGWTRTVQVGPIAHTWVLLATMLFSTISFLIKTPKTNFMPYRSRWIVLWIVVWWSWSLLLITLSRFDGRISLYRSLLLGSIAPVPFILIFGSQWERVKGFALGYSITSLAGGWIALGVLDISLKYLIQNPALQGIIRLGIVNYHWIAYTFAISMIFAAGFFIQTRRLIFKVFSVLFAANLMYLLLLIGSRQTIGAVFVALLFLFIWAQRKSIKNRLSLLLLIIALFLVGNYLLEIAPNLIIRGGGAWWTMTPDYREETLFDAFNIVENRGGLWLQGLITFSKSPVWGVYYDQYNLSHNYFIGILVNEGLVGFIFMLGLLVFIWKQAQGFWAGTDNPSADLWRTILISILIFSFVHAMASGTNISVWSIWWASTFLWWFGDLFGQASVKSLNNATIVITPGRKLKDVSPQD